MYFCGIRFKTNFHSFYLEFSSFFKCSIIDSSISKIGHHFEDIIRDMAAGNFQSHNGRHVKHFKMKSCRQSLRHLASDTNDTLPDFPFNCHCATFHTWSFYKTSSSILSSLTVDYRMCAYAYVNVIWKETNVISMDIKWCSIYR